MEKSSELFSPSNQYQVLLYYGDALYRTKDYKRAEVSFHSIAIIYELIIFLPLIRAYITRH